MKKIVILSLVLGTISQVFGQVVIGNSIGTATDKTSVLLEFSSDNKGLVLPYVRTLPSGTTLAPGTIVLDASSSGNSRIKVYNRNTIAGTNGWLDLSGQNGNVSTQLATQPTTAENSASKVIIGADTSPVNGVLVLESSTKAMVLPQVDDVNNIPSPSPGMMVFVRKEGSERLAVFNGTVWSFWKP